MVVIKSRYRCPLWSSLHFIRVLNIQQLNSFLTDNGKPITVSSPSVAAFLLGYPLNEVLFVVFPKKVFVQYFIPLWCMTKSYNITIRGASLGYEWLCHLRGKPKVLLMYLSLLACFISGVIAEPPEGLYI